MQNLENIKSRIFSMSILPFIFPISFIQILKFSAQISIFLSKLKLSKLFKQFCKELLYLSWVINGELKLGINKSIFFVSA